jgi:hypothetical protein
MSEADKRLHEALERATTGRAFSNYPAIFAGFMAKGIPEADIKPRENVFTFNAWKALGRSVKKGERGVKVITFITCGGDAEIDKATGEETVTAVYRKPHTTTVFHISQTERTSEREARMAERPSRRTSRRRPNSQWASGHGRYPPIWRDRSGNGGRSNDPGYLDPGELAADRWNETHGDKPGELGEPELLTLFASVGQQVAARCLKGRRCLTSSPLVLDYLRSQIGFAEIEHFRVLFLDKRNNLIADEEQQRGTVDHVPIYPREVLKRALELNAMAIVLAHNHPSGDTTPSRADTAMTAEVAKACQAVGIAVHDHVIIGRDGHSSLKQLGLM